MATVSIPGDQAGYKGTDKLLFGIIIGALSLWLFSQTVLNIAPVMANELGIENTIMNIAVSITTLFSGIFIVVMGGLADRFGRVRLVIIGFVLSLLGNLLIAATPSGALAEPMLMIGRVMQGLSGALILPASLALIRTYWQGAERQRAISFYSIGAWGW